MRTELTNEEIDQYQRDGVLVYRNLLSDAEVNALLAEISAAVAAMGSARVAENQDYGKDDKKSSETEYYEAVFMQKVNLWKTNDAIKKMFLGAELGAMVSRLAGVDGMRVWHDQTLQKMPWSNPTAW